MARAELFALMPSQNEMSSKLERIHVVHQYVDSLILPLGVVLNAVSFTSPDELVSGTVL